MAVEERNHHILQPKGKFLTARITSNVDPVFVGGTVFDGIMSHLRDNPLVSGICTVEHEDIRTTRKETPVHIRAAEEKDGPVTVVVGTEKFRHIFRVAQDGLIVQRINRATTPATPDKPRISTTTADRALRILDDVASGFRPHVEETIVTPESAGAPQKAE